MASGDLQDKTNLFVKQGWQNLGCRGNLNIQPSAAGKGHFQQRGKQTAVGPIVHGQYLALALPVEDQIQQVFECRRIRHIRGFIAQLTVNLS